MPGMISVLVILFVFVLIPSCKTNKKNLQHLSQRKYLFSLFLFIFCPLVLFYLEKTYAFYLSEAVFAADILRKK